MIDKTNELYITKSGMKETVRVCLKRANIATVEDLVNKCGLKVKEI